MYGNEKEVTTLLTVREVSEILHVSQSWVRDHSSGKRRPVLPSEKLGRAIRFRMSDIEQFLEECRRAA